MDTPQRDSRNRFVTGNNGGPGRPKGARAKLGETFLSALLDDFAEHGIEAIKAMRAKSAGDYVKVVASILPKEFDAGEHTLDVLEELLTRIDGRTRNIVPTQDARETAH